MLIGADRDKARAAEGVGEPAKKDLAQLRPTRDMTSNGKLKDMGRLFYQGFRAASERGPPAQLTPESRLS